jgi:hypothetical protein
LVEQAASGDGCGAGKEEEIKKQCGKAVTISSFSICDRYLFVVVVGLGFDLIDGSRGILPCLLKL